MELLCKEDYTDTLYKMKAGDSTVDIPSMSDEHKKAILEDYPDKFEVIKILKDIKESELTIENKESKLSVTKKSAAKK